jgi:hypothetical protein
MAGRSAYTYERECVIYLAKSVRIAKAGLARWQSLNLVGDEARCSNLQIMTLFVSVPITSDTTHGFVAPTQINPDMHLDLGNIPMDARIGKALATAANGQPCSKKPEADELVPTWHICQCLDNALLSTMATGLYHFRPTVMMPLLRKGETGNFSRSASGRWRLSVETEDGPVHRWLLPSPWKDNHNITVGLIISFTIICILFILTFLGPLPPSIIAFPISILTWGLFEIARISFGGSPGPDRAYFFSLPGQLRSGYAPVVTITSDQASMMFAAANFLTYSCQIRMVWFPDINHIESNAEKAVFVAAGLSQINEKVSFLARLPYGPRKDAGHWHSQMRQAFEAPTIIGQETTSPYACMIFTTTPFG